MSNTTPAHEGPLPPGFALERADDVLAIVSTATDAGEAFSLGMMGFVVLVLSVGLGARIAGSSMGALIGGAVALPAWGALLGGALGRLVNTTRLLVTRGSAAIVVSPIALRRRRELGEVTGAVIHDSTHTSSTRGSLKPLVIKTWSIWLTRKGAGDHCAFFELPDEASARNLCAHIQGALTR